MKLSDDHSRHNRAFHFDPSRLTASRAHAKRQAAAQNNKRGKAAWGKKLKKFHV